MNITVIRRISFRYMYRMLRFACLVVLVILFVQILLVQILLTVNARGRSTRLRCYPFIGASAPCVFLLRDESSNEDADSDRLVHFTHSGTRIFDALTGQTITSSDVPFDPTVPLAYQNQAASVVWSHDGQYMALTSDTDVRLYRRDEQTPMATFPNQGRFQPYAVWSPTANTLAYYSYDGIWLTTPDMLDEQGEASEPFAVPLDEDTDVYSVLWTLDGDSLLVLTSIEQYEYQLHRLDAETGESQAVIAEMRSTLSPSIKWLENGKLRLCCDIEAIGEGPNLNAHPTAQFELGDHFDIDGQTWEITDAPFGFLDAVDDSGRFMLWRSPDDDGNYHLRVLALPDYQPVDQWESPADLAPFDTPRPVVWVGDHVVIEVPNTDDEASPDPAIFVWQPEMPY